MADSLAGPRLSLQIACARWIDMRRTVPDRCGRNRKGPEHIPFLHSSRIFGRRLCLHKICNTFYIILRFMYDCRGFGTSMWPSLLWWFSIMATMVRVVATNVLFRVCRYWGLSLVRSLYRIINLLA